MKYHLIIGPPGTGKTTSLLNKIDEAMVQGVDPTRIACLTFTKKAAQELVERACDRFKLSPKKFPNIRTMHSLAYSRLCLSKDQIINSEHLSYFSEKVGGFVFRRSYDQETFRLMPGGELGDKCYYLYSLSKATRLTLYEAWLRYGMDVSWHHLESFAKAMDKFKHQSKLFDYSDLLEHMLTSPPIDVDLFIVDEAQDLTRQQWEVCEAWAQSAKQVYLAGDDDQSIFEWAGADVDGFINHSHTAEVLPISYRLPQKIFDMCDLVSSRITHRVPKTWSPRGPGGEVDFIYSPHDVDLSLPGSWYLLCRHRRQMIELAAVAERQGYPYMVDNMSSVDRPYVRAILTYERFRKDAVIERDKCIKTFSFIPGALIPVGHTEMVKWDDVRWPFEGKPVWYEAMTGLSIDQISYVRALLRRGESLTKTPRIRINTIHTVKGGEADNVLLMTGVRKSVISSLEEKPDEELRVWYVAASRARERLVVSTVGRYAVHNYFW